MGSWNGVDLGGLRLSSPRLTLRPFRADDAPAVLAAMQHRSMHEFLALPDPYTEADARAWVGDLSHAGRVDGTAVDFAVDEVATGRLIGSAGLHLPRRRDVRAAEIGYSIYPDGRGHHYAAEAADTLARWAFAHGLTRVAIRAAVGNEASARTALRAGFGFEALARNGVDTAGGAGDGAVFARCRLDAGEPIRPVFAPLFDRSRSDGALSDGVVTLRIVSTADAQMVAETNSDEESVRWALRPDPPPLSEAVDLCRHAALRWLTGPTALIAIVDSDSTRSAGFITLRPAGPPEIGLVGYGIHPNWRGRGFTARALRLLSAWAFAPDAGGFRRFHRLELGVKLDNIASRRAARSGGFTEEGIGHGALRNPDGSFSDEVHFGLIGTN